MWSQHPTLIVVCHSSQPLLTPHLCYTTTTHHTLLCDRSRQPSQSCLIALLPHSSQPVGRGCWVFISGVHSPETCLSQASVTSTPLQWCCHTHLLLPPPHRHTMAAQAAAMAAQAAAAARQQEERRVTALSSCLSKTCRRPSSSCATNRPAYRHTSTPWASPRQAERGMLTHTYGCRAKHRV